MAKPRKKKQTVSQQIMGIAAMAMPAPLRDVVTSRWGARLSLLVAAALLATGIVSLQWTDGRPQVRFNRQRATEVKQSLEQFEGQHRERERFTDRWDFGHKSR